MSEFADVRQVWKGIVCVVHSATLLAMAGKTPTVLSTEVIPLKDISVAEDSGWRPTDPGRIADLRKRFETGECGMGVRAIPSIRTGSDGHKMLSTHDGCFRLSNGKATVNVLKAVKR